MKVTIKTDASAAKGIASRRGSGKARHIEVSQLWVQDKVAQGVLKIQKIATSENIADHLTKYLNQEGVTSHIYIILVSLLKGVVIILCHQLRNDNNSVVVNHSHQDVDSSHSL